MAPFLDELEEGSARRGPSGWDEPEIGARLAWPAGRSAGRARLSGFRNKEQGEARAAASVGGSNQARGDLPNAAPAVSATRERVQAAAAGPASSSWAVHRLRCGTITSSSPLPSGPAQFPSSHHSLRSSRGLPFNFLLHLTSRFSLDRSFTLDSPSFNLLSSTTITHSFSSSSTLLSLLYRHLPVLVLFTTLAGPVKATPHKDSLSVIFDYSPIATIPTFLHQLKIPKYPFSALA